MHIISKCIKKNKEVESTKHKIVIIYLGWGDVIRERHTGRGASSKVLAMLYFLIWVGVTRRKKRKEEQPL